MLRGCQLFKECRLWSITRFPTVWLQCDRA